MRLNANWLWIACLVFVILISWSEGAFGHGTNHRNHKLCEYRWAFQPDLLPDLKSQKLSVTTLALGDFVYVFYRSLKTGEIEIATVTHIDKYTKEKNMRMTWQDGDLIVTTRPLLKEDFCIIKIKKHKGKVLDLTNFMKVIESKIKERK